MNQVKINNKTYDYHTRLSELTVNQFISLYPRVRKCYKNWEKEQYVHKLDLITAILDIDYSESMACPITLKEELYELWINQIAILQIKTKVKIQNKIIDLDKIKDSQIIEGQLEAFRQKTITIENKYRTKKIINVSKKLESLGLKKLKDEEKTLLLDYEENVNYEKLMIINELASIVLQPILNKEPFNPSKSKLISESLKNANFVEVYSVAFFLIIKFNSVSNGITKYLTENTLKSFYEGYLKSQEKNNNLQTPVVLN